MTAPITLAPIGMPKPAKKIRKPKFSEATRKASSERMKAMWADPVLAEKRREAAREAVRKRIADPEKRAALIQNLKGHEMKRLAKWRLKMAEMYDGEEGDKHRERARKTMEKSVAEGKIIPGNGAKARTPQGKANILAAFRRAKEKERGFKVPFHLKAQYRFLTRKKKLKPREAGVVLGLISENGKPLLQKKAA
jgi:hypothetical protein